MKRLIASLVALGTLSACGETSNFLGNEPSGGGSGASGASGSTSQAGAGGTADAGAGGMAVAGHGGGPVCQEAKALDGNWQQCGDGTVHRATPGTCAYTPSDATLEPLGDEDECTKDGDCQAKPFGLCQASIGAFFRANVCSYGCERDADCAVGSICVCAGTSVSSFGSWYARPVGSCHPVGDCASDADCGMGRWCTPYDSNPGCYSPVFTCQSPADECASPRDCPDFPHESCTFDGVKRVCTPAQCVVD